MTGDADQNRPFAAADDHFHFDVMSDRWWETETSWFSKDTNGNRDRMALP